GFELGHLSTIHPLAHDIPMNAIATEQAFYRRGLAETLAALCWAQEEEHDMADLPKTVDIREEGPREGFQIEKNMIPNARKVEFTNAMAQTGLKHIQTVSFVEPRRVPNMADAEQVVEGIVPVPGIKFTGLW